MKKRLYFVSILACLGIGQVWAGSDRIERAEQDLNQAYQKYYQGIRKSETLTPQDRQKIEETTLVPAIKEQREAIDENWGKIIQENTAGPGAKESKNESVLKKFFDKIKKNSKERPAATDREKQVTGKPMPKPKETPSFTETNHPARPTVNQFETELHFTKKPKVKPSDKPAVKPESKR